MCLAAMASSLAMQYLLHNSSALLQSFPCAFLHPASPYLLSTSITRAATGLLPFLGLLRAMLLHLLHAHVMIVMLDSLLGVRCQLRFPFTVALLGFLHGVLLVVLDF